MEIHSEYYYPSSVAKEGFLIHTKNGYASKLKYSDEEVRVSKTTFIEEFNRSSKDYIKRK